MNTIIKTGALCAIALLSITILQAQNVNSPATFLTKVEQTYLQSTGISLQFDLKVSNTKSNESYSAKGTAKLKKENYFIQAESKTIWYDGQKQVSYEEGATEAYISSIDGLNDLMVNPILFLKNYQKTFKATSLGKRKSAGKNITVIQFIPKEKNNEIEKIVIAFYESDYMMAYCELNQKNQQTIRIDVTAYKNGEQFAPNTFTFDPKRYPKVEIIDLR